MADEETDPDAYDPTQPEPPAMEPPRRSTAPQSEYTGGQIAAGLVVMLVGVVIVFGLPLVLA
ncbi:MAG: DUF7550 family protein [Natrialbaceae archaeon]